jgi:ADP-ribose pyrophosphatase YjhB (NUDIX family)
MQWRPPQTIRAISIAVVYRGAEVLVMAVKDDSGALKGWRPLGGAIEFGESAREAVLREFVEETGHTIRCVKQLCVLENRYSHEATTGHEIVFVFLAEFVEFAGYATGAYTFLDGGVANEVSWIPVHDFKRGAQRLYPEALKEYLDD